jgi:YebC/PmpR family DNA-binding regulatory protein
MGRVFEKRKHKMFKRYATMAKQFTKVGKEIAIAVKAGGPDPNTNARLRMVIQNSKAVNMPKERVDAAIQKAAGKADATNFSEVVYEGKGPGGITVVVETATDNPTRTIADLRVIYDRAGGEVGKTGSSDYLFDRKGVFRINTKDVNLEDLELEGIDAGLESLEPNDEGDAMVYCNFPDFGTLQKFLEGKKIEVIEAKLTRLPKSFVALNAEQLVDFNKMLEKLEDNEDVQEVYHNLQEEE